MLMLFVMHVRPILDNYSCVCGIPTGYVGDMKLLETVERYWMKNVEGLTEVAYAARLRQLELFSVKGRLLKADLIKYWKIFHGKCGDANLKDVLLAAPYGRTRGYPLRLLMPVCRSDVKGRYFGTRCVILWNSLPISVVSVDCLATFKRLAEHLGEVLYEESLIDGISGIGDLSKFCLYDVVVLSLLF